MALSKPIYNLLGVYFEQLFNHPVRTKSVTSCVMATSASYTSQRIAGVTKIQKNNLFAYGLFGLLFGGTVPHYFYAFLERITKNIRYKRFLQFLGERLIFAPGYTALALFMLAIFEGKSPEAALMNLVALYPATIKANWTYLTLPVFINFNFVPPILRVLVANLIGFFWTIFLANKRRMAAQKKRKATTDETKNK